MADNLRRAVEDGTDASARTNMSMAATMGALAFTKGLGAVHSLAHQLSTEADIAHGAANSLMLPHVMEFNLEAATQRYADIAQALGVATWDMPTTEAATASVESVRQLSKDIGMLQRLADCGLREESIPAMAEKAMADLCHTSNPRKCDAESMAKLYRKAF